jgi:Ca2+-transporting ATPase
MLDPKNLDTLEDMGGIDGLLDGLGTSIDIGLGSETGCSDDCLGAGVGHRPDPAKGEETAVPVITLTAPGGEKTTNWNPTEAFAASLNVRKSIYGENIIPRRPTKSLLSLLYTALKDKVLVCHLSSLHFWKARIRTFGPDFTFNRCSCFLCSGNFPRLWNAQAG